MTDEEIFQAEQKKLAGVWSLLCMTSDVSQDGDWITASLGGRSVFVQRFGDVLRAFENVCAHRFFPLRIGKRGNGSLRCGFHGWKYDRNGTVIDIPQCRELFGCATEEMDARLKPVEVGFCGDLVFGRIGTAGGVGNLEDFLGDAAPILSMMTEGCGKPNRIEHVIEANWKLNCHVSLEDYHIVSVHPDTFGARGPLLEGTYRCFRRDPHSALFVTEGVSEHSFDDMVKACAERSYTPEGYRIFFIFPNLSVLHVRFAGRWHVFVYQFQPISAKRTAMRGWFFVAPGITAAPYVRFFDPPRLFAIGKLIAKILNEDKIVCEKLQRVAHQADAAPILSPQEERVGWFEESYARLIGKR